MALQVWLPLNGNLNNQGLANVTVTNNGATTNTAGKVGSCYSFNGSGNCISIPADAVTGMNNNQFSASFWLKIISYNTSYQTVFALDSTSASWAAEIFCFQRYSTNDTFCVNIANGSTSIAGALKTDSLSLDTWYHFAIVYKDRVVSLYQNGNFLRSYTISFDPDFSIVTRFDLGRSWSGYYSNMHLNDFRIYDHALSPREVAEIAKGLVCHYPLGDSYLEGTTNLVADEYGITSTCYNGATSKYGYGANTDMYRVVGDFQGKHCTKVYMGTNGLSAYPYVYFNNQTGVGETKTLSFDYFPSANSGRNKICFYNLSTNIAITYEINGVKGTASNNTGWLDVNLGKWNHIVITGENVGSASGGLGYMQIGPNAHTSSTEYYWLFSNVQVELKDHATGYTPFGTTRAGGEVSDTSGFGNNGTINTDMVVSDNTARYLKSTVFDGVANCIKVPFNDMLGSSPTDYTVSVWTYKTVIGTKNYQTILGGPTGFELEARSSSSTNPLYRIHNWGGGTTPYEFNKWTLFTFVRTASDSKLYVNGELKLTGTSGTVPTGNYFIGAWSTVTGQNYEGQMSDFRIYATALTADQVKQLYEAPISLANNGTLFANELVEV